MNEPIKRGRGRPKKVIPPNDGSEPDLPEHMWAAVAIEFSYGGIGRASLGRMKQKLEARGIKRGREMIRRWRLDPLYSRAFGWILAEWMEQREAEDENAELDIQREVKRRASARLPQWLATGNRWHGATRSMLNGAIYTTPEAYAQHLLDADRPPIELLDEVRAELAAEAERIRLSA
jgi:hypothetical protein